MIGTEQKVWEGLRKAAEQIDGRFTLTRIETLTRVGVSDVEYASSHAHGWVEIKTSSSRETGNLVLHHPFSIAQQQWLSLHHDPKRYLHSWLLVGVLGARTWRELLLLPPAVSIQLVHVRPAPLYEHIMDDARVVRCKDMHQVARAIYQPSKEKELRK